MKPLLAKDVRALLLRFDNFKGAELITIRILAPTNIQLNIRAQDRHRDFNWIQLTFDFNEVVDAKIIDDSKLSFVDMSDGISIDNKDSKFAFGIGDGYNISNISDSICFFIAKSIKYKESIF